MFKFFLPVCRLNFRKFSFSHRVVSEWNSLPPKAVNQTTVSGLKNIIDSIFGKKEEATHKLDVVLSPSSQDPISILH